MANYHWVLALLTFLATGNKPSKTISPTSPLGCLLETLKPKSLMPYLQISKLIRLCTKKWPKYPLDNNLKWTPNGTLDPDILQELSNFYQHTRRWKEHPYIQAFYYLSSKPSVLVSYSPTHMFLAMPSKPEEHPASALCPVNETPSF